MWVRPISFEVDALEALSRLRRIDGLQKRAAAEFSRVFFDITRPCGWRATHRFEDERPEPQDAAEEYGRYKAFSNHWSAKRKRGDRTLSVFVAAVVDRQPLDHIAQDNGLTVQDVERMVVEGLQDYARRAGWR